MFKVLLSSTNTSMCLYICLFITIRSIIYNKPHPMTKEQFEKITAWQKETFGEATASSKLFHLIDEIKELHDDIIEQNEKRRLEFADCFFLLFGCAAADGMSYEDIVSAISDKFEINKARNWGKPDANGVVNHIRE